MKFTFKTYEMKEKKRETILWFPKGIISVKGNRKIH